MGNKPRKDAYPPLYFINNDHGISVRDAIDKGWGQFSFSRSLFGEFGNLWMRLKDICEEVLMYGGRHRPMWMLTADKKLTIKSLYLYLIKTNAGFPQKFL